MVKEVIHIFKLMGFYFILQFSPIELLESMKSQSADEEIRPCWMKTTRLLMVEFACWPLAAGIRCSSRM